MKNPITILGVESSCDDTSAAVICNEQILSNIVATQDVHVKYGGVVPELASRAHQHNIIPTIDAAIKAAGISISDIDAIAFTNGPGLLGSLLVGNSFAKGFSMALNIPMIEVNHMQAHILAHFIDNNSGTKPNYPFLCLTVSGGHTQIVLVSAYNKMEVIGKTLDDAAGEAFDKTAKILGLPYPGGPLIDKYAKLGNPEKYSFPMPEIKDLDYSFSGIKTAFLYFIKKQLNEDQNFIQNNLNDICASIQFAIVRFLLYKLKKAIKQTGIKEIALAGGVSANSYLRAQLTDLSKSMHFNIFIPEFEFCTDNAAMIAITGYYKYLDKDFCGFETTPSARMKF